MRSFGQRLCQLEKKAILLERRIGAANESIMIRRDDETWIVNSIVNGASKSIVSARSGYRTRPAKAAAHIVRRHRRYEMDYVGRVHRKLRHGGLRQGRRNRRGEDQSSGYSKRAYQSGVSNSSNESSHMDLL
jgi:hypothetical protein